VGGLLRGGDGWVFQMLNERLNLGWSQVGAEGRHCGVADAIAHRIAQFLVADRRLPQGIRQVWPGSAFAGGTMTNGAVPREQLLTGPGCRLRKTCSRQHDQDDENRLTDCFQVSHPIHRTTHIRSGASVDDHDTQRLQPNWSDAVLSPNWCLRTA
jgi:hypothetical protein